MQTPGAKYSQPTAPLVTGQIVITTRTPAFSGATVHVRLEDTSYADAEAVVVAETIIPNVGHAPSGSGSSGGSNATRLPFTLHAAPGTAPIDPRNDYAVRVWMDCDSDGKAGAGDLYSDQSYRVLTHGFGHEVTILLDRR
jgi:hypothetical protein